MLPVKTELLYDLKGEVVYVEFVRQVDHKPNAIIIKFDCRVTAL